ncbi:MAG: diaminopimelate decarboxylase [Myxococcota bacterium]|nr:diaminopimelate decarboxylase [Myxococcota bacterium]
MDFFVRKETELYCEEVPLSKIANDVGTPAYVYSAATIARHVRVLQKALEPLRAQICYAVKANSNLAVLELLKSLGCGFDAVSLGELKRVEKIKAPPKAVIFSGVGKRDDEIAAALEYGPLYICVESAEELGAIAKLAEKLNIEAPISIRVNPNVDPKTHAYIATGLTKNKFGVPIEKAYALYQFAKKHPLLKPVGVTCHIGSQITTLSPFIDTARIMHEITQRLISEGITLDYLGMGGGLGIPYTSNETPPDPDAYGKVLAEVFHDLPLRIVFEPGRVIVGNAGVLLSRVIRRKIGEKRNFIILDTAMNDLIRPSLYHAHHELESVTKEPEDKIIADVVGPVCESADTFLEQVEIPNWTAGDLVAIRSVGAYGFVMSSTYNGRPRPPEVICYGDQFQVIRARESYEDLWQHETPLSEHDLSALSED